MKLSLLLEAAVNISLSLSVLLGLTVLALSVLSLSVGAESIGVGQALVSFSVILMRLTSLFFARSDSLEL